MYVLDNVLLGIYYHGEAPAEWDAGVCTDTIHQFQASTENTHLQTGKALSV